MTVVGFAVIFAGVVSSVLAGATTSLLLAFILPVSLPASASAIPDRLAGWGLASVVAVLAVALLWPAPARDPLRGPAAAACRALAARLHADVAFVLSGRDDLTRSARADAVAEADAAVAELQPHLPGHALPTDRPEHLGAHRRPAGRRDQVAAGHPGRGSGAHGRGHQPRCLRGQGRRGDGARARRRSADRIDIVRRAGVSGADGLTAAMAALRLALDGIGAGRDERAAGARAAVGDVGRGRRREAGDADAEFVTSLDPSFRAQEISFAVSQIAANIELTAAAERRTWWARLTGHQPAGVASAWSAAQERAVAHVERHSVWLHNSLRGAVGLGLAVLVADLSAVQHSFWVVLGALSVLRSSALNTGQNALRGLLGTVAGFVLGAALLAVIGTNPRRAVDPAGAGDPGRRVRARRPSRSRPVRLRSRSRWSSCSTSSSRPGWQVGPAAGRGHRHRLCGQPRRRVCCSGRAAPGPRSGRPWPRPTRRRRATWPTAVAFGMDRCDGGTPRRPAPTAAAVAGRRRVATTGRHLPQLPGRTGSQAGAAGRGVEPGHRGGRATAGRRRRARPVAPRRRHGVRRPRHGPPRTAGRDGHVGGWYDGLADSLTGRGEVPAPLAPDEAADGRLIAAVRHDLRGADGHATATAVRMIWTGDHVDAARRLQGGLVGPARTPRARHVPTRGRPAMEPRIATLAGSLTVAGRARSSRPRPSSVRAGFRRRPGRCRDRPGPAAARSAPAAASPACPAATRPGRPGPARSGRSAGSCPGRVLAAPSPSLPAPGRRWSESCTRDLHNEFLCI